MYYNCYIVVSNKKNVDTELFVYVTRGTRRYCLFCLVFIGVILKDNCINEIQ